jgi:hypothetical protein
MACNFRRHLSATRSLFCAVAAVALSVAAQAQPAGVSPEAQRILKASTDFLASQQRFSVETRITLDVVLKSGQKIELNHTARQWVQRPNKLLAERTGDLVRQRFLYDGKSLTLYEPGHNVYAQVDAPATLDDTLDFARTKLDIIAPASDLLSTKAYDILTQGVTEGMVVGKAVIEGAVCDHLAFRAPEVDFQVWVQEGAQPLPRKFVITTRDLPDAPQFSVTVTRWNLKPAIDDRTFAFKPPAGAHRVEFLPR